MRIALLVSSITLLLTSTAFAADDVVATVNGTKIKKQTLDTYTKFIQAANNGAAVDPDLILKNIVNMELLYQEAMAKKLDKDPDVSVRAEMQRKEIFANELLRRSDVAKPISDDELKKIYDEKVKNLHIPEYKARHILVKTEDEAKSIIAELDKGTSFEELAKTKSTDPGTKEAGGDLGWFSAQQMVPEFTQAVAGLQKGAYTKVPVQTRYGYHVIKLEDTRTATPPSFEDSKKQIIASVQNGRVMEYIESLRKKAKIDIKTSTPAAVTKPGKKPDADAK
ncbi:MAG: peptidylprolyl isomerase [Gammaproteobacteria bacterium]|nr:peptidylprolyl isomerase [Gammaproteobacteria bacterium]